MNAPLSAQQAFSHAPMRNPPDAMLEELRAAKALSKLMILQRGNRLSVTPVQPAEFRAICALASPKG